MYLMRMLCKRRVLTRLCYFVMLVHMVGLLITWAAFRPYPDRLVISGARHKGTDTSSRLRFKMKNFVQPGMFLNNTHPADVYTYDLPDITDYSFVQNKRFKEYVIPVMSEKKASYGPNLDPLTVLIIPFSHVDPGYGMTMEAYYSIKTKNTLNYMVEKLDEYRNMTFQWAETVFLERWWRDINEDFKQRARGLIQRGQLEIVLGGWVMPDEASTHYVSVIDQLIEGHQWLIENLGVKPRNSWSNDPFGFSSTMPYLWRKAGMENMVILRIHQAIKATLMKLKAMEFNWQPLWSSDPSNRILCHLMPYRGYWIGDVCGPYNQHICREYAFHRRNPVDKVIFVTKDNVAERSKVLYEQFRITAEIYRRHGLSGDGKGDGGQLYLPIFLGEDFSYTSADEYDLIYTNFKMLFDYINFEKDWKMNIKFGTLKEYFSLIRTYQSERSQVDGSRFPSLAGDFFPYSDYQNDYWTGYYTTRPFNKQFSRELQSVVRLADVMHVYALAYSKQEVTTYQSYENVTSNLRDARRELGMFLHHDGITGTSVLPVIQDFQNRLFSAYKKVQTALRLAVSQLLVKDKLQSNDLLLKETSYRTTRVSLSKPKVLTIHNSGSKVLMINPSGRTRTEVVSFMTNSKVTVLDASNIETHIQVHNDTSGTSRILFVTEIPAFGIESFFVVKNEENETPHVNENKEWIIENEYLRVEFDKESGLLSAITDEHGIRTSVVTELLAYTSKRSGAYIFEPTGNAEKYLADKPEVTVARGSIMSEITVKHKGFWISMCVYHVTGVQGQGVHIRTELDMRAIDIQNKEVIIRFETDINSENKFYTDQNGFQLLGRKTYADRPIEQNYYPLTSMAILEDDSRRLTLHSAQPHGVASLKNGWLEIMLDRQVNRDDDKGLGQGVGDNVLTAAQFVLQIEVASAPLAKQENKYTFPSISAVLMNEMVVDPLYTLFLKDALAESKNMRTNFYPMTESLQCGLFVVGMRNLAKSNLEYNGTSLILHQKSMHESYGIDKECDEFSAEKMTLKTLFPNLNIKDSKETSLTHLDDLQTISSDDDLSPSPMELKSFKIMF